MVVRERDRTVTCARKPGILFIYLSTRARLRLRFDKQVKFFRLDSPLHSWRGVENSRVPACIFRVLSIIRSDSGCQVPVICGDWQFLTTAVHHGAAAANPSFRVLALPPSLSPSHPNPFKKHLFTFRIFRTVLPTAVEQNTTAASVARCA